MNKNKLILGTVQFGLDYGINNSKGKPSINSIKEILDFAYLNRISMLDTAEIYGDSQEKIGSYIKESGNKFEVVTKFSPKRKDLPENIKTRVYNNLNILNIDYLYAYMFHSFDDFKEYYPKFEKDLEELKKEKIIKKIGVSLHSNEEIEEVIKYATIDIIQLPFNLLDNQNQRGYILDKAKKKGIEIHTRSVFLQGLFFKKNNSLNNYFKPLFKDLIKLKDICNENYMMNDLALNYAYNQPYIDKVLIGVDSAEQLKSNIISISKGVSKKIIDKISEIKIINKSILNPANWK